VFECRHVAGLLLDRMEIKDYFVLTGKVDLIAPESVSWPGVRKRQAAEDENQPASIDDQDDSVSKSSKRAVSMLRMGRRRVGMLRMGRSRPDADATKRAVSMLRMGRASGDIPFDRRAVSMLRMGRGGLDAYKKAVGMLRMGRMGYDGETPADDRRIDAEDKSVGMLRVDPGQKTHWTHSDHYRYCTDHFG